MPQKPEGDGLKYIVAKLETVHTALNECIYFTSDADLKREILNLASQFSQLMHACTTDEEVHQRWLETQR